MDGTGYGCAEVPGGGEGLADLGGQAPPFGDGERCPEAAQCDVDGDVIAADNQQHAQSWIVAVSVAQVVVDKLVVEIELTTYSGSNRPSFSSNTT